jgi:hypothetical protein
MLEPIVIVRRRSLHRTSSILESDGVRRQDSKPPSSERRSEGLELASYVTGYLTFSEVELAVVLVIDNDAAEHIAIRGREKESRNLVTFEPLVFNPNPVKSVELHDIAPFKSH